MDLTKKFKLLSTVLGFIVSLSTFANSTVQTMVVFGDSLSDNGNTTHLLKSLRRDENPSYLVSPLKTYVTNKMIQFAEDYYIPQTLLDAGLATVEEFFDNQMAPMLVDMVAQIRKVPVLPGKPYWQSRFSNGPVWNEYLADMLHIDMDDEENYVNKAFGGSWTVTYDYQLTVWNLIRHPILTLKSIIVGKLIPPSLGLVVQAHLLEHPKLDPDAVYFIFSGANDYINMLRFDDNYNSEYQNFYIDNVVENLNFSVTKLVNAGAKRMVIIGLPHVGNVPKFIHTPDQDVLNHAVDLHNQKVDELMHQWESTYPETDFLFIDLQKILGSMDNFTQQYAFLNMDEPCIDIKLPMFNVEKKNHVFKDNTVLNYAQDLQYVGKQFAPGEKNYHVCDDPEQHFYWDDVHPSSFVHQALAYIICDSMHQHGYKISCDLVSK